MERNYNHKDVDMLVAAKTVTENFIAHKTAIVAQRAVWADPFITTFRTRIDTAISSYLGLDPKKDLKLVTQTVNSVQTNGLKDLAMFKVNIETDYKTDKIRLKWLLDTFGYSLHWVKAQQKDQEALVELLYKFKQNMTAALQTEITAKGTSAALITKISAYADTLKNANINQETLKGTSKELSAAAVTEFNAIYTQTIAICKIASKLFSDTPTTKDKFSFSKIVKKMSGAKPPKEPETPPVV